MYFELERCSREKRSTKNAFLLHPCFILLVTKGLSEAEKGLGKGLALEKYTVVYKTGSVGCESTIKERLVFQHLIFLKKERSKAAEAVSAGLN